MASRIAACWDSALIDRLPEHGGALVHPDAVDRCESPSHATSVLPLEALIRTTPPNFCSGSENSSLSPSHSEIAIVFGL